jgi:prefoldin subunit 5
MNFLTSILRAGKVEDGTRRAAIETIVSARETLENAVAHAEQTRNKLTDTIGDLMRENDRLTKRRVRNARQKSD